MKNKIILSLSVSFFSAAAFCQQAFPVTDSLPYETNGLRMGFTIKGASEKEVGDKGNFSRYSIKFYVTNISDEAKIILYKQGFTFSKDPSLLAQFNCLNATGARFTTKESLLQASDCSVVANVDDKDCSSGKTVQNKRLVQIGYWIKAGETISNSGIVIVPLNEKPNMTVTPLYKISQFGSTVNNSYSDNSNSTSNNNFPQFSGTGYVKIKNYIYNTYLNNQNGPVTVSSINNDWWSPQWQIIPVRGTSFYAIKNRWNNSYLSNSASNGFLSQDGRAFSSMWLPQQIENTNYFTLKNAADNTFLSFQAGNLITTPSDISLNSRWIFE